MLVLLLLFKYLVSCEKSDTVSRLQVPQSTSLIGGSCGKVRTVLMKFHALEEKRILTRKAIRMWVTEQS